MSPSPFDGLEPKLVWSHFEKLTRIPRCSRNEAATGEHIRAWAEAQGFGCKQDAAGNVVVQVPASAGKDSSPTVVLQGHLDMVGEKDSSSSHNFDKDPIPVLLEGDVITADGTTLGADNGIGLAAAMAVAEDPDAVHGPLELLCTVEEEIGLNGAQALAPDFCVGKTMLNLDSEEDGAVYVGCAGGADTLIDLPLERGQAAAGEVLQLSVSGFKGGHSGLDINTGRGNAIKTLAGFLDLARKELSLGLIDFKGGDKHNAIPREASALVTLSAGERAALERLLEGYDADLKALYGKTDPGVTIAITKGEAKEAPLTEGARDRLLDLILALPHGVIAMSQAVEGLVETSTNLAVTRVEDGRAHFHTSSRSSVMPAIAQVQATIFAAARLAGGTPKAHGAYPGWAPDMDSNVLKVATGVHESLFGKAPEIKAIHAGLECGIIGEKFGGMDMLSLGPQIENPHSPSELLRIETVGRFYDFVKGTLAALAK